MPSDDSSEAGAPGGTGGSPMSYRTPMGAFDTWEAAAEAVERSDMDPCTCIEIVVETVSDGART